MSFDDIIQDGRDLIDLLPAQALDRARRRHPLVGGFGVFPVYAPLEIIHAAGLLPVGLFGAGNKIEVTHADSRFASFICSIAKTTLELFLRGDMNGFAGAVFSSICDVARNLSSVVRRNAPDLYIEYLHLPQNAGSAAAQDYTRAEYERFRANLSRHLNRPIPDEAICRSLTLYNRVRRLTRALCDFRRSRPGSISAAELRVVVQAGTRMMPEDFADVLQQLVELVPRRKAHARDCVKVVIEGAFCELPPLELIEAIEAAGCQVRDDDMVIGWRLFSEDVMHRLETGAANGDALAALAHAYLHGSVYTSVRHDGARPRTEGLLHRIGECGADAVMFLPAKFCEPALLDYVLFRRRLDEKNVPHLKLEFEEKMWTFDAPRTEVETFAESMLFD